MPKTLVHTLEAVQADRQDGRVPLGAGCARKRLPDPVVEQGAVREVGQKVVQSDLGELSLERLAFPNVARGEDDLPDGGVVQAVGGDRLDLTPDSGGIPQTPLDGLGNGSPGGHIRDESLDSLRVVGVNQPRDRAAHQLGTINPEDAPDCRCCVGHDAVTIDEHDGIGAVRGQRPESFLRLPPCLFRQQTAVLAQHEFLADQHHRRQHDEPRTAPR